MIQDFVADPRTTARDLRDYIECIFSGSDWYRRATVEHDDGGAHVEVRVTSYEAMLAAGMPAYFPGFKLCVIAEPEKAS